MNPSQSLKSILEAIAEEADGSPLKREVCAYVLGQFDTDEEIILFRCTAVGSSEVHSANVISGQFLTQLRLEFGRKLQRSSGI